MSRIYNFLKACTRSKKSTAPSAQKEQGPRLTVRRVWSLTRPELPTLTLATICLLLSAGLGLVYPQAIRVILNAITGFGDRGIVDKTAVFMVMLVVVEGALSAVQAYFFTVASERVVARLRRDLYAAILRQEIGFFDEQRTGELTSRLTADTTVLQSAATSDVSNLLKNCVTLIGALSILVWTSFRLTLVMLLIVPIMAAGAIIYGRFIRRIARAAQSALAHANDVAEETLSGIRTVRAFARESTETRRYEGAVFEFFRLARRCALIDGVFSGIMMVVTYAVMAGVFWYGGMLVLHGQLHIGDLTSFILYTLIVISTLGSLSGLWSSFNRTAGASERVFELLDRTPTVLSGTLTLERVDGEVCFDQIEFAYPARPSVRVLHGLNLRLRPGEIVAVVGHSGAGKSTIASLLARFYDPQGGCILLDSHDLRTLEPSWLRRQIGVVAQEPILFATSILENICYGKPDATKEEVEAAARAANAHDFILNLPKGYDTLVGERGVQLSGGQKQRIAIARALLKDPRLLVLDEATSALDTESEALVQAALDRLMIGRTTLIIAHRLSTVLMADRVLVLDSGIVVQEGRHADLVKQDGLYRKLVERQFAPVRGN